MLVLPYINYNVTVSVTVRLQLSLLDIFYAIALYLIIFLEEDYSTFTSIFNFVLHVVCLIGAHNLSY